MHRVRSTSRGRCEVHEDQRKPLSDPENSRPDQERHILVILKCSFEALSSVVEAEVPFHKYFPIQLKAKLLIKTMAKCTFH